MNTESRRRLQVFAASLAALAPLSWGCADADERRDTPVIEVIHPDVEVSGTSLLSMIDSFGALRSVAMRYLVQHVRSVSDGKRTPQVEDITWYPLRECLKALQAIEKEVGSNALFGIGQRVVRNATFPKMEDLDAALRLLDTAYHMNHRKGGALMFDQATGAMLDGIGHYGYRRQKGDRKIVSVVDTPYPCQFDMGIVTALARMLEPRALTTHEDEANCRSKGGSSCTYVIAW